MFAFFRTADGAVDWPFVARYLWQVIRADTEQRWVIGGVSILPIFVALQDQAGTGETALAVLVALLIYAGYVAWEAKAGVGRFLYPLAEGDLVYARLRQVEPTGTRTVAEFSIPIGQHRTARVPLRLKLDYTEARAIALHDRASGNVLLPTMDMLSLIRDPDREKRLREDAAQNWNMHFMKPGLWPSPG